MAQSVRQWLQSINLNQYLGQFTDRGITTIQQCASLQEPDLVELGILLPGHRRRMLTHLPNLASDDDVYENISCLSVGGTSGGDDFYGNTPNLELPPELPQKRKSVKADLGPSLGSPGSSPNSGKRPVPKPRKPSKRASLVAAPAATGKLPTIADPGGETGSESNESRDIIEASPGDSSKTPAKELGDSKNVIPSKSPPVVAAKPANTPTPPPPLKPKPKQRPQPTPRKPSEKQASSGAGKIAEPMPGSPSTSDSPAQPVSRSDDVNRSSTKSVSYDNLFSELNDFQIELEMNFAQPTSKKESTETLEPNLETVDGSRMSLQSTTSSSDGANRSSTDSNEKAEAPEPILTITVDADQKSIESEELRRESNISSCSDVGNEPLEDAGKAQQLPETNVAEQGHVMDDSNSNNRESRTSIDSISKLYGVVNKPDKTNEPKSETPLQVNVSKLRESFESSSTDSPDDESIYESIWLVKKNSKETSQSSEPAKESEGAPAKTTSLLDMPVSDFSRKSAVGELTAEEMRASFADLDPFNTQSAGVSVQNSTFGDARHSQFATFQPPASATTSNDSSDLIRMESFDAPSNNLPSSRDSTISFHMPEPLFSPPPLPSAAVDDDDIPMPGFAPPPVPFSPTCPTAPPPPPPVSGVPRSLAPPPPVPARSIDAKPQIETVTTPTDIITHQPLLDQDPFGDFWAHTKVPSTFDQEDVDNYDVPPPPSRTSAGSSMTKSPEGYDIPPHPGRALETFPGAKHDDGYDHPPPARLSTESEDNLFATYDTLPPKPKMPTPLPTKPAPPIPAGRSPVNDFADFARLSEVVPIVDRFASPPDVAQDPWSCAEVPKSEDRPTPTRSAPPPPLPPRGEGNPFESFKDGDSGLYTFASADWKGSTEQLDTSCGVSEGSLSDGGEFLSSETLFSPSEVNMGCANMDDISSRIPVIPHIPKSMEKSGYLLKHAGKRENIRLLKKKWVTFKDGCLRYFKDNKHRISDRIIPVATMKNVENDIRAKDFRFKLTTVDRVYIFSSDDRDSILQWTSTLMQAILNYKPVERFRTGGDMCNPDKEGFIGIGNEKGKRYFVVKGDKVAYYNNYDDYKVASPIHEIEMNLASVKELFGKNKLQLSTPYKQYILNFEMAHELGRWQEAFQEAITVGLSDDRAMKQLYENPSNRSCADCGEPNPDWAATHLLIVICKKCAGIHRELWPFKVKSLRMDLKVWKPNLVELYVNYGNEASNSLWEYDLDADDKIQSDCEMSRRKDFLIEKYCNKKFIKAHALAGEQLNEALCSAVQYPNILESMESLFSGADLLCSSEIEQGLTPLQLAERAGQTLQVEFLNQNGADTTTGTQQPLSHHYQNLSSLVKSSDVSKRGWMHKTGSNRKEFLRRWCTLEHKVLSYYLDDKSNTAKDSILANEMISLYLTSNERFRFCFELGTFKESGRAYLFALEDEDDRVGWTIAIAKTICPDGAAEFIKKPFERAGYVYLKEGSTAEWKKSWIQLHPDSRILNIYNEARHEFEEIDLRKMTKIQTVDSSDPSPAAEASGVVFVVNLPGRWLYIQGEHQRETTAWLEDLTTVATTTSQSLRDQQLTAENTPVLVDKCINFIYTHGMTTEGIYRRNGTHSKITSLLKAFAQDARSVILRTEDYEVHDVANVLKRYFRTLSDPLLTKDLYQKWLETAGMVDHTVKMQWYKHLIDKLPEVNRCSLKKLILHLKSVSEQNAENKMTVVNLASIFGPALMTLDHDQEATRLVGFDTTKYEITTIVDMLQYNTWLFEVEDEELAKEKKIQEALEKMKSAQTQKAQAGEFIMGIYMNTREGKCLNIKVPANMTAEDLVLQISATRDFNPNRYALFEVICQGELERPLNDHEKILDVTLNWSSWDEEFRKENYLCVKPNYVQLKVDTVISPHLSSFSELKFSSKKGFKKFFFQFSQSKLSYFKDSKCENPEASWNAEDIILFMGVEKRRAPPKDTPFCFSFILRHEHVIRNKDSPYFGRTVCCASEEELYRWVAAILTAQRSTRLSCLSTGSSFDYSFKESPSSHSSNSKKSMFKKTFNMLSFRK